MVHLIRLGVGSDDSLEFWAQRLRTRGYETERALNSLRFADYDGLSLELVLSTDGNPPLRAEHPEIPAQHAIVGVEGARAYTHSRLSSRRRTAC